MVNLVMIFTCTVGPVWRSHLYRARATLINTVGKRKDLDMIV